MGKVFHAVDALSIAGLSFGVLSWLALVRTSKLAWEGRRVEAAGIAERAAKPADTRLAVSQLRGQQ